MTRYDDALRKVLQMTHVLEPQVRPLVRSGGQVLCEDVCTDIDLPQSDISIPDGYAVRSADIHGANSSSPVILKIIGTLRAGRFPGKKVVPGGAIRIMTGSLIPKGADCVVQFEDTDEPGNKNGPNPNGPSEVRIFRAAVPGANIQPAGSNVRKGSLVVPAGTVLGPAQLSVLSSIGKTRVKVVRRPVVAIIATGDELAASGRLYPAKCYNSNTVALESLVGHYGGIPKVLGIARDRESSLVKKIGEAVNAADMIVTSGGVSKGDYDLVRLVLRKLGEVVFSLLDMGPGRAVALSIIKGAPRTKKAPVPVFGLPGPPQGCLVDFEMLVRPAILKMRGITTLDHHSVEATAVDSVPNRMNIAYVRFTDLKETRDGYQVTLNVTDRVGILTSMATTNSFTVIPKGSVVNAGDRVRVLPLSWGRDQFLL